MSVVFVDIDNTITETDGMNYAAAKPNKSRIKKINKWYSLGNIIVYWTSRGMLLDDMNEKKKLKKLTLKQLKKWGCLFHSLRMDKPLYDVFFDDKTFNSEKLDDKAYCF